ncbi:conserved oligomeric Golgi complex subunit 2 [Anopheles ziemanni]|uniref:conserved oligomeric Golgi complex subunit 2 n=1 Tax=Anopheles coustani TaxID=139045 RepID=UPI00265B563A|nr:conserved oligomeric Golgi complex subunit 2 [Anopheles coustani]XP_058174251.1 conserved oligomeric Golgi complex subunit 2 [Anopheles ziemanni]
MVGVDTMENSATPARGELFSLPAGPASLCFDKNEFMKKTFSVDEFLHENRNAGSLEIIRDDLGMYLKVLRSAMIELINQDYADFVDLSANLIGLDQQIAAIGGPLEKLRDEVGQVKGALEASMTEIERCLEQKKMLRAHKKSLQSLGRVQGSLEKLESMLLGEKKDLPIDAILLERAALESIQLQFNIEFCRQFLDEDKQRLAVDLWSELLGRLKSYFLRALDERDSKELERCLRIYCTLDECRTAEEVFRREIVAPYMNRVISETSLQNAPQGLTGIYNQILDFVSMRMKQLCQLTKRNGKVKGYSFIVNSFWTEVERRMETNMSSIFAPGNPDAFYQKYKCTLEFLERIEQIIDDPDDVAQFKAHAQYRSFQVRWNLPVYFQIRFQEIGASIEASCTTESSAAPQLTQTISASQFNVAQFSAALTAISKCWQEGIFLPQLFHRFLKLTLQILARLTVWCESASRPSGQKHDGTPSSPEEQATRVRFLVALYSDLGNILLKIPSIVSLVAAKSPPGVDQSELEKVVEESGNGFREKRSQLQRVIVQELIASSLPQLRQVSDIPRLYRKTNRELPSRCCPYVEQVLAPTDTFRKTYGTTIGEDAMREFLTGVYSHVTVQYYQVIDEVLTSVQKTEESLRRLKNLRDRSATGASAVTAAASDRTAPSDDDKIRLQLQADVMHFVRYVEEQATIPRDRVDRLPQLVQLVDDAIKGPRTVGGGSNQ